MRCDSSQHGDTISMLSATHCSNPGWTKNIMCENKQNTEIPLTLAELFASIFYLFCADNTEIFVPTKSKDLSQFEIIINVSVISLRFI